MPTNLVANPDFTPEVVTIYPGVALGRGAAIDEDRAVFNGTSNAPFVTFDLNDSTIAEHTYGVSLLVEDGLVGTLHLATAAGPDSQAIGVITASGTTTLAFQAVGSESGFTVTGDLHNCAARFGAPTLSE